MDLMARLDPLYEDYRANRWMRFFAIFCRVSLALVFIPSGMVKEVATFISSPTQSPEGAAAD